MWYSFERNGSPTNEEHIYSPWLANKKFYALLSNRYAHMISDFFLDKDMISEWHLATIAFLLKVTDTFIYPLFQKNKYICDPVLWMTVYIYSNLQHWPVTNGDSFYLLWIIGENQHILVSIGAHN
jgi:hypothetical protein